MLDEQNSQPQQTPAECCPAPDILSAWLDQTLDSARLPEIESHVETCARCQEILERLTRLSGFCEQTATQHLPNETGNAAEMHDLLEKIKQLDDDTELDEPERVLKSLAPSDYPGALGRLGRFEVLSVLGWGGMGTVYRAFDPTLNRVVAVKVLAPHLAHRPVARRRFIREAQAAAAICHEHVVTIHGIDESPEHPMIIMQYVPGRSLQDYLDTAGFLDLREILRIGLQTAGGLAAAHAQGLVHRDIKPANILLENGVQRVRLTDFGLARAVDDATLTLTGVSAGTPQFMSPEQASGGLIDARSDLFSLGCVLYAMCVGHSPFRGATTVGVIRKVCDTEPRPIRDLNPDIPDWLCQIIGCLLEKIPADRFQTAEEVAILLERWLAHVQQPLGNPAPDRASPSGPSPAGRRATAPSPIGPSPTGGAAHSVVSPPPVTMAAAAKDIAARCVAGINAALSHAGQAARRISTVPPQTEVHNPTQSADAWTRWYQDCRTREPELVWKDVSWTPIRCAFLCAIMSAIAVMLLCPDLTEPVRTMLASSAGWCLSIPLRRILCAAHNGGTPEARERLPVPPDAAVGDAAADSVVRRCSRWVALSIRRGFDGVIGRYPVIGEDWLRDAGIVAGPVLMLVAAGVIIEAAASADGVALLLAVVYLTWLLVRFLQNRIHGSCFAPLRLMLWCVAGFAVLVDAAILFVILEEAAAAIPVLMLTAAVGIAVMSFSRSVGEQAGLFPARGLFEPWSPPSASAGVVTSASLAADSPSAPDGPDKAGHVEQLGHATGEKGRAIMPHSRAPFRSGILWAKLFSFPALASVLLILRLQRGSWESPGSEIHKLQSFVAMSGFLYLVIMGSAWCLCTDNAGGFRRSPGVIRAGITSLVLALVTSLGIAAAVAPLVWEWSTRGGWTGEAGPGLLWPGLDGGSDLSLGIVLIFLTLSPLISSGFRVLAGSGGEVLSDLGGWLAACVVGFGSVLLIASTGVVFWLLALELGAGPFWRDPFLFGG